HRFADPDSEIIYSVEFTMFNRVRALQPEVVVISRAGERRRPQTGNRLVRTRGDFHRVSEPEAALRGPVVERDKPYFIMRRAASIPSTVVIDGIRGDNRGWSVANNHQRRPLPEQNKLLSA